VLEETFNAVKILKPAKIFLIQDGPRNSEDIVHVEKCREIVTGIDWPCEIFRNYSDVNLGCGARVSSGLTWAFTYVEKLVVIEDDCVPSPDFMKFCSELLNKYEFDCRIDMICGMNHLDTYEKCKHDYFFCRSGSIWGWATWRRAWQKIEFDFEFLMDEEAMRLLEKKYGRSLIERGKRLKLELSSGTKLSSWSYQRGISAYLNSGLSIVPKFNLIKNIGIAADSANSVSSLNLIPIALRRIYKLKIHKIASPLNHPKYVIADIEYDEQVKKIMASSFGFRLASRKVETALYRLISGDFKGVYRKCIRYLRGR